MFESLEMSETIKVLVPDIGEFQDVEIIEVHVKPGDRVELESPLITLESDKATIDIPSPSTGKVGSVKTKVGDKISEGDLILLLEVSSETGTKIEYEEKKGSSDISHEEVQSTESTQSSEQFKRELQVILMPDMGEFSEVDIIDVI